MHAARRNSHTRKFNTKTAQETETDDDALRVQICELAEKFTQNTLLGGTLIGI